MRSKTFFSTLLWGFLLFGMTTAAGFPEGEEPSFHPAQRKEISFEELKSEFRQPDMIYAPFAFWFFDTALDPEHAARMAAEISRQRMNPGYAHPRRGLPREEWLSPLWFETFDAALKKAEAAGGYLGYCDEYWWPSGRADGRVLEAHPELAAVSLKCRTFDLLDGESVELPESFFTVAARHAEPFHKPPLRPAPGKWIWNAKAEGDNRTAYFRQVVETRSSKRIRAAALAVTADNSYTLHVNGAKMGENPDWHVVTEYDLSASLRGGRNVIAVEAANADGPCGLIFGLRIVYEDGTVQEVPSDEGCRSSDEEDEGWRGLDYDDSEWTGSTARGDAGAAPWLLSWAGEVHSPAVIRSATLALLHEGGAFDWKAEGGSWRIYSFSKYHHPGIDGGDVNYIDRRLPAAFIEIAHEPYDRTFGGRMGRSIPGVFVDNEGDYGYKIAWSEDLDREYRQSKGRDIRLWMPLLLDRDEEGLWAKARWDWYDVVSEIYTDSYLGEVSRWLGKRGMYCISNLWEESLAAQAFAVGDFFKAQRAVSMPGNDCLVHKALQVHDFKETQSVIEFEGRRFQSEVLGVAGWQMLPVLMKKAANAVIAWGVSHIVPHGVNLNRKLDTIPYPPDWFESNPYWPHFHLWTDFARRASYVNSKGHLVPDVLLVNPMDSTWALLGGKVFDVNHPVSFGSLFNSEVDTGEPGKTVKQIESVYAQAIEDLTTARIEYLIADRYYLERMKVSPEGCLSIGPFEFKAAVLPDMLIWPLEAAQKLLEFAEAGGPVYLLGSLPRGSTDRGMDDPEMLALMKKLEALPSVKKTRQGVPALVAGRAPFMEPQVRFVSGEFPVLDLHRRTGGRDFFWLANNTGERRECTMIFRETRGRASIWNCETGAITTVPSRQEPGGGRMNLSFDPCQAFWVVFDPKEEPMPIDPADREEESSVILQTLEGPWQVGIDPSVQPPAPVPPGPKPPEILKNEESAPRPLASWLEWGLAEFTGYVDYKTEFELDGVGGRLVLDLGAVKHMAEVWVNGKAVGACLWPPFAFEIGDAVRPGRNELLVRVGNLLCNAMKPHATWGWSQPEPEDFDAGLFGPVVLKEWKSR